MGYCRDVPGARPPSSRTLSPVSGGAAAMVTGAMVNVDATKACEERRGRYK